MFGTQIAHETAINLGVEIIQRPAYNVANPGEKLLNFIVFRDITKENAFGKFKTR